MSKKYDAVVLGVGAMGSAACYHLARRGLSVLGIEQFEIGHDRGSSHGRTRVIRKAYFEDPRYVPLLHECYALWHELEAASGETLMQTTGCLNMGPAGHECILGVRESVERHELPHEFLAADEIRRRWSVFQPNEGDVGVFEADGGMLFPEKCVAAHVRLAEARGCRILQRARVEGWSATPGGVVVQAGGERFEARHLVITAGAWLPVIAAQLGLPLIIERQVQAWFAPAEAEAFAVGRMPVFIHFLSDRSYYGLPHVGDGAVKVARHHGGTATTADTADRTVSAADEADIRSYLLRHLPEADGKLLDAKVCLYTNTPDDHFIIDRHPRHENVSVAGGFSGHGFKFSGLVGRVLSDLIVDGRTASPIELFSIARLLK
ncbi:MAG TPA: N-methyl-L-tryptophan oxidase [Phycisphaerae bacterium]|nr:N-methyl-L-tryptophan oxidase [Phycisphaerae bacterium]